MFFQPIDLLPSMGKHLSSKSRQQINGLHNILKNDLRNKCQHQHLPLLNLLKLRSSFLYFGTAHLTVYANISPLAPRSVSVEPDAQPKQYTEPMITDTDPSFIFVAQTSSRISTRLCLLSILASLQKEM